VRVRNIKDIGTILDKSVTLGVNEGGNITFANADPSVAITQARTAAIMKIRDTHILSIILQDPE
jgi:uncharacterized protein YggE